MLLKTIAGMKFMVASRCEINSGIRWEGAPDYIALDDKVANRNVATLYRGGRWVVRPGFLCDGASGPTFDDTTNLSAAVWHDVGYQALRAHGEKYFTRKQVDDMMLGLLLINVAIWRDKQLAGGAGWWRKRWIGTRVALLKARYRAWHAGLRLFAGYAAKRVKFEKKYRVIEVI